MVQATDEDLLRFAARQSRVLYSFNLSDFCRIHREWIAANRTHAGIVLAPQQRYSVGDQLRRLLHLIGSKLAEEMKDRVEFLSNWG